MKYMIITKRSIFTACMLSLVMTVVLSCLADSSVATSAGVGRQIPIYCVDTDEKKVAITFDAAWSAEDTDTLIEILSKYNARATFFVVGEWAQKNSESVKKLCSAGHEIANHSYNHTAYSKLSQAEICEDIKKCNECVFEITGKMPTLLRAPSGDYTEESESAAKQLSMRTVQWSVDSLDWRELSSQEIEQRVLRAADNGSIILFHNGVKNTPAALENILSELQKRGFSFVSVSELIYPEPYRIDATGKQQKN